MRLSDRWRSRLRTAEAMIALSQARLTVATTPFDRWRGTLGKPTDQPKSDRLIGEGRRLAAHVEWAAKFLPFRTKCLQHAMALSWMLRRHHIGHAVVFAVRPAHLRGDGDSLHAWVEMSGQRIIGDLPGPWTETLRIGS
ncbi:MAG TPA: lasso peptide biosynthesis B2 protein [Sphingomicrobium sp.]|nr:lasso peptide biosynthesis B2 protein [Sphingomicrobium sp.]